MVLVYPVISMGQQGHGGSRNNLLGPAPSADLVKLYSNEKQVTKETPLTFLTHAKTDAVVSVENSRMFYEALKAHGVKAELLEFPEGNHGYNGYKGKEWDAWQKRCVEWLAEDVQAVATDSCSVAPDQRRHPKCRQLATLTRPHTLLLRQFLDVDLAEAHRAMVALQEDRPGLTRWRRSRRRWPGRTSRCREPSRRSGSR